MDEISVAIIKVKINCNIRGFPQLKESYIKNVFKNIFILNRRYNYVVIIYKLTPSRCPSQQVEARLGPDCPIRPTGRNWRWRTRCWIPEKLIFASFLAWSAIIWGSLTLLTILAPNYRTEFKYSVCLTLDYGARIRKRNSRILQTIPRAMNLAGTFRGTLWLM